MVRLLCFSLAFCCLVSLGSAQAQECSNFEHHAAVVSVPLDVRLDWGPQDNLVLLRWRRVEEATAYQIYREISVDRQAQGPAAVVGEAVPWARVEATPEAETIEATVDPLDAVEALWGVQAVVQSAGRGPERASDIVWGEWTQISTAVEAMTWGQVKADAVD